MTTDQQPFIECYTIAEVGQQLIDIQPGDIVLTQGKDLTSYIHRIQQFFTHRNADEMYREWSHAAIAIDTFGELIEVTDRGVQQVNINKYDDATYCVIRTTASAEDIAQMVAFATHHLTTPPSRVAILCSTLLKLPILGGITSSGLVAQALERTSIIHDKHSFQISPADLGKFFLIYHN